MNYLNPSDEEGICDSHSPCKECKKRYIAEWCDNCNKGFCNGCFKIYCKKTRIDEEKYYCKALNLFRPPRPLGEGWGEGIFPFDKKKHHIVVLVVRYYGERGACAKF